MNQELEEWQVGHYGPHVHAASADMAVVEAFRQQAITVALTEEIPVFHCNTGLCFWVKVGW